jgi:hypothetical protein
MMTVLMASQVTTWCARAFDESDISWHKRVNIKAT